MANEKRLIDAYALMKAIKNFRWNGVPKTLGLMFAFLGIIISGIPTVDAAEVVRCKDCKHCIRISRVFGDVRCGKLYTDYIKEDDFCSYGERRTDERKAD